MSYPNNGQELFNLFGDLANAGYISPIFLTDAKVGFSIQKNYPADIQYKPAQTKTDEDDNIAVIWVVYESQQEKNHPDLIPIRLRIATMSKYRALHWDYDFEDTKCPTEDSVMESKKSPQPLELNSSEACFYSQSKNVLVDADGNVVSGHSVLDELFKYHCDTVHPIRGFGFRSKNWLEGFSRTSFDKAINSLVWILTHVFGRTLDERRDRNSYFEGYLKEKFKKISVDSIELAGYRASKKVILIFSILVVISSYLILPVDEGTYLGNVLKSEFLMVVYSILCLYLLDELIPNLLFWSMNACISQRKRYLNWLLSK